MTKLAAAVLAATAALGLAGCGHGPPNPSYDAGNCTAAQHVQQGMQAQGYYDQTDQDLVDKYCTRYLKS